MIINASSHGITPARTQRVRPVTVSSNLWIGHEGVVQMASEVPGHCASDGTLSFHHNIAFDMQLKHIRLVRDAEATLNNF